MIFILEHPFFLSPRDPLITPFKIKLLIFITQIFLFGISLLHKKFVC